MFILFKDFDHEHINRCIANSQFADSLKAAEIIIYYIFRKHL